MGDRRAAVCLKCVVICTLLTLVSALNLPSMSTTKPRYTKYSSSTLPPASGSSLLTPATVSVSPDKAAIYRVKASNGATCILLKTDSLIEIKFKSHIGDETGDSYLPDNPTVEGNCQYEDSATMRISWSGYSLLWNFAKTPGGERWYIDKIELSVSTDIPYYHNIRTHGSSFKLFHNQMLFPTPVGKSFTCDDEQTVKLVPNESDDPPPGLSGTLYLRALQLQPFMYKGSNFGPPFKCNAQMGFKDETAPIAVGSTLAIAVLMTITGYGIFRYFKVKKVQYNTME